MSVEDPASSVMHFSGAARALISLPLHLQSPPRCVRTSHRPNCVENRSSTRLAESSPHNCLASMPII
jgi:hypothetical protein